MQYKGYEIQITEEGCIIRNGNGDYIVSTPDETEAKEYIDDIEEEVVEIKELPTDWYQRFDNYCNKLVGKCYPTSDPKKFGTTYGQVLDKFAKSFESSTKTKVIINIERIEGDLFYIVDEVYKE